MILLLKHLTEIIGVAKATLFGDGADALGGLAQEFTGVEHANILEIEGNSICNAQPVNFWNPARQFTVQDGTHATWSAVTTGGMVGAILTLDDAEAGILRISTAERDAEIKIADIGLEEQRFEAGGLGKSIQMWRLPEEAASSQLGMDIDVSSLHAGDNPIYMRVMQEDGHLAWSSPIYVVRKRSEQ